MMHCNLVNRARMLNTGSSDEFLVRYLNWVVNLLWVSWPRPNKNSYRTWWESALRRCHALPLFPITATSLSIYEQLFCEMILVLTIYRGDESMRKGVWLWCRWSQNGDIRRASPFLSSPSGPQLARVAINRWGWIGWVTVLLPLNALKLMLIWHLTSHWLLRTLAVMSVLR